MRGPIHPRGRGALPIAVAVVTGLAVGDAEATTMTYRLHNHPDGNAGMPMYGVRLDELLNVTDQHDIFTFDFDREGVVMKLIYDDGGTSDEGSLGDDTVRIFGTAYGGLDVGSEYHADYAGLWEIDFTYRVNFLTAGGGSNLRINPDSPQNNGWIAPLFDVGGGAAPRGTVFSLADEDGGKGYSFAFNNTEDHRLAGHALAGTGAHVGWGWLNHSDLDHIASSDWLFTAERVQPVPEPTTMALVALGLACSGIAARRRRGRGAD